jgi:hypothetical protein
MLTYGPFPTMQRDRNNRKVRKVIIKKVSAKRGNVDSYLVNYLTNCLAVFWHRSC